MGDFLATYERLWGSRPIGGREKAFVTERAGRNGSGTTTITTRLSAGELAADEHLLHLDGRLVGADQPNTNNQLWTSDDLRYGLPSVATGPLNWLHNDQKIIGCITSAQFLDGDREAADEGARDPHIRASSVLWRYLFPAEARVVAWAAEEGSLFYSMECISREVECAGHNGCGAHMSYADALRKTEKACEHVRDRASARRLVDPVFQGAAVIVPPKRPGWQKAFLSVVQRKGEDTLAGALLNA